MTDDLISRKAVGDALCNNCDHVQAVCPHYPCKQYTSIERQPSAEPEQRWIPVTERLPDDGEDVLITFCGEEETRIVPVNYYQKIWFDCIFDIELNPHMVTAWMPLPEPWKGGADEKHEYERASDERDYCERFEPTYNPDDGSM